MVPMRRPGHASFQRRVIRRKALVERAQRFSRRVQVGAAPSGMEGVLGGGKAFAHGW